MNKDRELDNLNIMRENGLISETTYQAQRHALLGTTVNTEHPNPIKKRLTPLSLIEAFKFSFQPATFGATFVFLFVTLMFLIITSVIVFASSDILSTLVSLSPRTFLIGGLTITIILSIIYIFWQSVWVVFFSRLALEHSGRDVISLNWKTFALKSLIITGIMIVSVAIIVGAYIGLLHIIDVLHVQTMKTGQQRLVGIALLSAFVAIILGVSYLSIAALTSCIGLAKYWMQTFVKMLKRPLTVLFVWGCLIFNGVVMFVLAKLFDYSLHPLTEIVADLFDAIMDTGLGIFGVYLVLGIIYFFAYTGASHRGRFWLKMSFLFVIPSLIILITIIALIPFMPKIPTSVYFAYFLVMHLFWFLLYCASFFVVQEMAFLAHVVTQVWCHITHDKNGNNLFQMPMDQTQVELPHPKQEPDYVPPAVFR